MGRPREVVSFLLALFLLLGTMHETRAQYEDYDGYGDDYEEDYDYDEDEHEYEDEADDSEVSEPEPVETAEDGKPPTSEPQNQEFTPTCNNENCWMRVDWEPPPRDTWMSCLLGYRVGFRKPEVVDWTWMNVKGTHRDLASNELFFFEEAEGTNHSLTIPNLDFETDYSFIIEVFNPYGTWHWVGIPYEKSTPRGSCIKVK